MMLKLLSDQPAIDTEISVDGDVPIHILTHWMGILVGLGIEYSVNKGSPLYKALRESVKERHKDFDEGKSEFAVRETIDGVTIFSGSKDDDTKVKVRLA